jgi:hypothetical protein
VATRRTHRWLAGHGSHPLDAQTQRTLVRSPVSGLRRLPNSRGRACPIAAASNPFGIDIFSRSCITRHEDLAQGWASLDPMGASHDHTTKAPTTQTFLRTTYLSSHYSPRSS